MIKAKGITKHFDDFKVLDDLSLHVRKGTVYGLVGPNGAGKTTLINHLNGVLRAEKGEVTINGQPVYENPGLKQTVLSIADDWFYYSTYTVKEMAKFYNDMYVNFNRERYEKIGEAFKIDEKSQLRKLSKGMKKQVAFWLALSCSPDVLILDEPLDGLDPVMRKQVLGLVIQDVAERGMTVLVSSHNLRELEDISDWIGVIHNGKIVAEMPIDDMKGSLHKYQVVIAKEREEDLKKINGVLHITKTGSVYNVIIRGDVENAQEEINTLSPRLCERISLTLEEVFIYELGGLGYDFKNILL